MDTMNQEIMTIIEKNLPSATASSLKKYLDECSSLTTLVDSKVKEIEKLHLYLVKLEKENKELNKMKSDWESAKALFKLAQDKEQNMYKEIADLKVKSATEKADSIYKLTEIVFRNRQLVHNTSGSQPMRDENGYVGTYSTYSSTTTEEV